MANRDSGRPGEPTDEEVAAALAAVHAMLRRESVSRGSRHDGWTRAAHAEAVGLADGVDGWASAERPR